LYHRKQPAGREVSGTRGSGRLALAHGKILSAALNLSGPPSVYPCGSGDRGGAMLPSARDRIARALLLLFLLTVGAAAADPPGQGVIAPAGVLPLATTIQALHLTAPVKLDGVLDEAAWQGPSAAPLIQNEPDNGAPPVRPTDWWFAYDDEALYVAARMHDTAPDSIRASLGRRDTYPESDWFFLNLDTFDDDRNGYSFCVNPAGCIGDAVLYNDGWDDNSWDGIWSSAARVDAQGWAVEIRIPFSQLRFPPAHEQRWGINVSRRTLRNQERDELFHRPREESGYIGRFPHIVGLRGIHSSRKLEVLTYGASKGDFRSVDREDPFREGSDFSGDAGADLQWGLTSDLTLNATINPDFGQVEVDPAIVNLSDAETFYQERRPFFVKDASIFRFAQEGTNNNCNFNWMEPLLFYSRRIGRAPTLDLADHDYADVPGVTTILGAAKLSGKLDHTRLGLLSAVTAKESATLALDGVRSSQVVEPLTHFTVLRAQRTRQDGRQGLGIIATSTLRDLPDSLLRASLPRAALAGGIDGWTRLDHAGVWAVRGYLSGSLVDGSAKAIDDIQRSSRHYLQRPDADHLRYDPTRTALAGWIARAALNKESGATTLNAALGAISPGYEISDLGYESRSDVINTHVMVGYQWLEPNRTFRYRSLSLGTYRTWDTAGRPDVYGEGLFYNATFTNYWSLNGMLFHNPEHNALRTTRGGPVIRAPESGETNLFIFSDERARLSGYAGSNISGDVEGSRGAYGEVQLAVRPSSALRITVGPTYSWSKDTWRWVANVTDPTMTATYGTRYLFGDLEYRELSIASRVDWTFTPRLTLQAYLQPLLATGRYTEFKELARGGSLDFSRYGLDQGSTITYDPSEAAYTIDPDGPGPIEPFELSDPNFNYKSLKVNVVLRWEFRPGSTFYLVWTQNREDDRDPGDFEPGRDFRSLLDAPGENIVMAKVTVWWSL